MGETTQSKPAHVFHALIPSHERGMGVMTTRKCVFKRALLEQVAIEPSQQVLDGCGTGSHAGTPAQG